MCKQPIKGDSVESNKKFYHPDCMKCYVCGETLRGSYFTYKNQPICEKDYKVTGGSLTIKFTSSFSRMTKTADLINDGVFYVASS